MLNNKVRDKIKNHFDKNIKKDSIYQEVYEKDFTQDDFTQEYVVENEKITDYDDFGKLTGYRYLGDELMDARDISMQGDISLVFYSINDNIFKPYLIFVFEKKDEQLIFPRITLDEIKTTPQVNRIVEDNYSSIFKKIDFQGHYKYNNELFLFYNVDSIKSASKITASDLYYRLCLHEIVNLKESYNTPVSSHANDFFVKNEGFCYLEDEEYNLIETPTVAYTGSYYKKIAITAALGPIRGTPTASMGPYFYFSNFNRAMRYAVMTINSQPMEVNGEKITIDDTPIYKKGGIVKFILFLGKEKVFLNRDNDPDDTSEISKNIAENSDIVKATIKNRDNDSKWINEYNSTIITFKTIEYKGKNKDLEAQITIKDSEQTDPISFYYVDTKNVIKTATKMEDGMIEYNYSKGIMI